MNEQEFKNWFLEIYTAQLRKIERLPESELTADQLEAKKLVIEIISEAEKDNWEVVKVLVEKAQAMRPPDSGAPMYSW